MQERTDTAVATVEEFLDRLHECDTAAAADLLADDVRYINVPLPAIKGRAKVGTTLERWLGRRGAGIDVRMHSVASDGQGTVLTERTDILIFGPVRISIWVCGRFDVEAGRITLWKDYFDWSAFALATLRGLVGAVIPSLRVE